MTKWIAAQEELRRAPAMDPDEEEVEDSVLTERGEPLTNGEVADALREFSRPRTRR